MEFNSNPKLGITHLPSAAAGLQGAPPRAILNAFLHMVKPKLVGVVRKPQDSQMFAAPEGQSGGSSAHHLVSSPARRKRVRGGGGGGNWSEGTGKWIVVVSINVRVAVCWEGGAGKPCLSGKSPLLQPHKSLLPARNAATLLLLPLFCLRRYDRNLLTSRLC